MTEDVSMNLLFIYEEQDCSTYSRKSGTMFPPRIRNWIHIAIITSTSPNYKELRVVTSLFELGVFLYVSFVVRHKAAVYGLLWRGFVRVSITSLHLISCSYKRYILAYEHMNNFYIAVV